MSIKIMCMLRVIFKIIGIILITIVYRWLIYFIHELGHFIIGKGLGYRCKITLDRASIYIPRLATNIKGNHKITIKQDLLFSINGVILAEITNIILIFLLYNFRYFYLLIMVHIPIIFIDMIPDGNSDGKWVIQDIKKIYCLNNKVEFILKKVSVIVYSVLLLISTLLSVKCYIQYYDTDWSIRYGLPILLIFYITSYRYIYHYIVNSCKEK